MGTKWTTVFDGATRKRQESRPEQGSKPVRHLLCYGAVAAGVVREPAKSGTTTVSAQSMNGLE